MPLQATSGAASYDAFGGGAAAVPNYIEDVFSTYLYTGTGSAQTITNGVDLSGKGGLVWIKSRSSGSEYHVLQDTVRGRGNVLSSNTTDQSFSSSAGESITTYNSTGFSLGINRNATQAVNTNSATYASWTFRKQPKFFDVVTWTGNNVNGRAISHALNSTPGMILVKCTSNSEAWYVWHRSESTKIGILNGTDAFSTNIGYYQVQEVFGNGTSVIQPTSTDFTVAGYGATNETGRTYVAYLFAHDAGGFGLTGTDNVISCGSYTTVTSPVSVNLGYEPQWLLVKRSSGVGAWALVDNMRGWNLTQGNIVVPNTDAAEADAWGAGLNPTATGFTDGGVIANNSTMIYIAIRRGPMKVPTSGTSVFDTQLGVSSTTATISSGFVTDAALALSRPDGASGYGRNIYSRLQGNFVSMNTTKTDGEATAYNTSTISFSQNNGIKLNGGSVYNANWVYEQFQRAPGFFDVVCYTGTGANRTVTHNLTVAPEMIICKKRQTGNTSDAWWVYSANVPNPTTNRLILNETFAANINSATLWNSTAPTSSVFSLGTYDGVNETGLTFVSYLFATCAGVSKVGSYTGNGSTQTINCGFTGGARFVMVKATSTTGNWIVADSARGIVAGNDPALYLNSTAAEVTGLDWIDADNSGFVVNETATIAANTNGVSYIFFAVA